MTNPYASGKLDMTQDKYWYARATFGQEEIDAVVKCLNEFQLSPGKYTYQFEREVAKLFGKDYAVMVNFSSFNFFLLGYRPKSSIRTFIHSFKTIILNYFSA